MVPTGPKSKLENLFSGITQDEYANITGHFKSTQHFGNRLLSIY